jgi:hypothetical protein
MMDMKYFLKIFILSIIVLFALPSFAGTSQREEYKSNLTQKELTARILKLKNEKKPGRFIRINNNVLKFEGYIDRSTYLQYLKNIDDDVKVLVINCLGGDTYSGVKMGLDIQKRGLKVIVEGLAVSSGANYIFLAGREKIIKNGVVGFHGNTRAFEKYVGWVSAKAEAEKQYKMSGHFETAEKMRDAFDKDWENFEKEQQEVVELEKEFYEKLGVSQQLFDITQTDSKGLDPGLKENFDFFLPSPAAMKKFNIKNVSGEQNIPLAESVGIKGIYW